jgi:hypothetical protein
VGTSACCLRTPCSLCSHSATPHLPAVVAFIHQRREIAGHHRSAARLHRAAAALSLNLLLVVAAESLWSSKSYLLLLLLLLLRSHSGGSSNSASAPRGPAVGALVMVRILVDVSSPATSRLA